MAGCGPIKTKNDLETWLISTLTVAWHHQCHVTLTTKFGVIPPDGPGLNPAAIISLGYYLASGFNLHCGTTMTATDFFGCVTVKDMLTIIAAALEL
jgi:hypothetical protein